MTVSGTQWTIRQGDQTAVVVEVGGGLRGYQIKEADVLDGYDEGEIAPGASGHVLAPWPNRLRDGTFRFDGELYQLPLSEPEFHNAIHGLVRWSAWTVTDQSPDSLTVEHVLHPQPGYPWRLRLGIKYTLSDAGLRVDHTAVNESDLPAPFGLGAHPYVRIPGVALADTELCIKARTRLLVDGRLLPIGAAKVAGTEWDYSNPRRIGGNSVNAAFGDIVRGDDGGSSATIRAEDGRAVTVWADGAFGWWQLYTGDALTGERRRRSIALEPMTCPPDALRSGRDLIVLEPGRPWTATWGILCHLDGGA